MSFSFSKDLKYRVLKSAHVRTCSTRLCKNEPNIESGNKAKQLRTIINSPQMPCL